MFPLPHHPKRNLQMDRPIPPHLKRLHTPPIPLQLSNLRIQFKPRQELIDGRVSAIQGADDPGVVCRGGFAYDVEF